MDIQCTRSALRMAARRRSQAYGNALASEESLTVSYYAVLGNLAKWSGDAPPSVTELSQLLGLDRTMQAHSLRPLERDGFLAVLPDARLRRVAPTAEGRAMRDRCLPLWRAAQERFDQSFGIEEARALRASLAALSRHTASTEAAPAAEGD